MSRKDPVARCAEGIGLDSVGADSLRNSPQQGKEKYGKDSEAGDEPGGGGKAFSGDEALLKAQQGHAGEDGEEDQEQHRLGSSATGAGSGAALADSTAETPQEQRGPAGQEYFSPEERDEPALQGKGVGTHRSKKKLSRIDPQIGRSALAQEVEANA